MNKYKLQQLKEQRKEIQELLALFNRAAFRPHDRGNGGDPTAALNGIYETRIALQMKGAVFVEDENAALFFEKLQNQLGEIENNVRKKYPQVTDLAIQWRGKPINTKERIESLEQALGKVYTEAANFIRNEAFYVYDSPQKARPILAALDEKIERLINSEDSLPSLMNEAHIPYPPRLADVHELLITHFNEEELKTLCFLLSIDYESLVSIGKASKARELVLYSHRNKLLPKLKAEVTKQRPEISWPDIPESP